MHWQIEFFEEIDGGEPVRKWLDSLPVEVRGRVLARISLLAEHGPALDHPYTSQIEGKLREVRLRFGKTRYRVLYFFDSNQRGILLHGFTKNTDAVEESDKRIGRSRMDAHLQRIAIQRTKSWARKKR